MALQVLNTCLSIIAILCAVLLYIDCKGAREALGAWQLIVATRLDNYAARLAALEGGPGTPPPAATALARSAVGGASSGPSRSGDAAPPWSAHRRTPMGQQPVGRANDASAPSTMPSTSRQRSVPLDEQSARAIDDEDEATQIMDAKDTRATVTKATGAPSTQHPPPHEQPVPIAAQRAIRLGVPSDRVLPRARQGSSPTLVSAGNEAPPPASEPRSIPLERQAELTAADIARVDAHAARHGITREAMLAILVESGRAEMEALARDAMPPSAAPTRVERIRPPPLDARVERRWHELLATAQAQGKLAQHCTRALCMRDGFTIGACPCECEGCARIKNLLARAKREIAREHGQE